MKKLFLIILPFISYSTSFSQNNDSLANKTATTYPKLIFVSLPDSIINKDDTRSIMLRPKSKEERDLRIGTSKINFTGTIQHDFDKYSGVKNVEQKRVLQTMDPVMPMPQYPKPTFTPQPIKPTIPMDKLGSLLNSGVPRY